MKIIFFIEDLSSGGKERRLIELVSYLRKKDQYELLVVLTRNTIHYPKFLELDIPYEVIERKGLKKDPRLFYYFYRICKRFKPDVVHVWGNLNAFYALPAILLQRIPLINSQITDAPPLLSKGSLGYWTSILNFLFSSLVVANSYAGLGCYNVSKTRGRVVYNGVNLDRFQMEVDKSAVKKRFNIHTKFLIIMVARFSDQKDYDFFIDIAKHVTHIRDDITFVAVGDGPNLDRIKNRVKDEKIFNVLFTGRIKDVEILVSAADIGVLLTARDVHGEGISNAIIEYMALGKPVIANDAGGTSEIVKNGFNGHLLKNEKSEQIAALIIALINNQSLRLKFGLSGKDTVEKKFTLDRMGREFEILYYKIQSNSKRQI